MTQNNFSEKTKKKSSKIFDIIVWISWLILMWGFLGLLAITSSPKDSPGLHEAIILAYFLGFGFFFGLLYYITLKRGI
ncbi:hypothetical protein ACJROX_07810 [Pseudalkalibacillus sp. A8]|uniref:hypothetical protein n=1 Tax=Pseudalkalibacillus sp. A8 TaxID=3382641 RepID=UPI0038B5B17E